MKYDVHIYAVVRVKLCGVEADDQKAAIEKAEANINLGETFSNLRVASTYAVETEYADEVESFLVDEVGDDSFTRTRSYDATMRLIPPNTPKHRRRKS